ncbi:MAG: hypothetical protein F4Y63_07125 [Chloroflexi bacterium]|nr:hypothetical protein [Chloroflexota bacterium]
MHSAYATLRRASGDDWKGASMPGDDAGRSSQMTEGGHSAAAGWGARVARHCSLPVSRAQFSSPGSPVSRTAAVAVALFAGLLLIGLAVWTTATAQTPAVGELQLETSKPTSLTVVWEDVTGADSYTIRWRLVGSSEFTLPVAAAGGRHQITGLLAGREYVVQVLASDADGTLLARLRGAFRPALTTPIGFAVTGASAGSLTVSWTKPEGWDPSAYELRWRRPSDTPFLGSVRLAADATGHTLSKLSDQTQYVVNLIALNDADDKSFDVSDTGWAVDPLQLTLSASSDECVAKLRTDLSWEIAGGLRPYRLWVQGSKINLEAAESHRVRCGSIPIDSETGEGVVNPTKTFAARVLDARGTEANAEATVKLVKLSGPTLSVGAVGSSTAALSWSAPTGWAPVAYRLRWRLPESPLVLGTVDLNAEARSHSLGQLDGSQEYVVRLTAVHGSGLESLPDTVRLTTKPQTLQEQCEAGTAVPDAAANDGLVDDCATLLELRDALAGSVALNWSAAVAMTAWNGVTISGAPQRVTKIELPSRGLNGQLAPELGQLANLQTLSLSQNSLSGDIPPELQQLEHLVSLALAGNQFTGCIPYWLNRIATHDLGQLRLPECSLEFTEPEVAAASVPVSASVQAAMINIRLESAKARRNSLRSMLPSAESEGGAGGASDDAAAIRAALAEAEQEIARLGAIDTSCLKGTHVEVPYVTSRFQHRGDGIAFSSFTYEDEEPHSSCPVGLRFKLKDPTQFLLWKNATHQNVLDAFQNHTRLDHTNDGNILYRWQGAGACGAKSQYIAMRNRASGTGGWTWVKGTGLQPVGDQCLGLLDSRYHFRYFSSNDTMRSGSPLPSDDQFGDWTVIAAHVDGARGTLDILGIPIPYLGHRTVENGWELGQDSVFESLRTPALTDIVFREGIPTGGEPVYLRWVEDVQPYSFGNQFAPIRQSDCDKMVPRPPMPDPPQCITHDGSGYLIEVGDLPSGVPSAPARPARPSVSIDGNTLEVKVTLPAGAVWYDVYYTDDPLSRIKCEEFDESHFLIRVPAFSRVSLTLSCAATDNIGAFAEIPNVLSGNTYYVTARAYSERAASEFSEVEVFTVECSSSSGASGATSSSDIGFCRLTPRPPSSLTVENVSDAGATLKWTKSPGATGYAVRLDGKDVDTSLGDVDRFRFDAEDGYTGNTAHALGVSARNETASSRYSALTVLLPPSPQTSRESPDSIGLSWTLDENANGAEVRLGSTGRVEAADSNTSHTFDAGIDPGVEYTLYVRAKNDEGRSAWATAAVVNGGGIAGDGTVNIQEKADGFSISGTAAAGASVRVTVGGTTLAAVTANAQGGWSVSVPATNAYITEGSVSVSAQATKAGHPTAAARAAFQVDLTAPTVSYVAPSSLKVDSAVRVPPTTTDTDIPAISAYALANGAELPSGLRLNPNTGVVSGTPTERSEDETETEITIRDRARNSGTATLTLPRVEGLEQVLEGFAYSPAELAADDDAPTLTAPTGADGALSYSVTDDSASICSVNETSGALEIDGAGVCKVVATAAATRTHEAGSAMTTVTIRLETPNLSLKAITGSSVRMEWGTVAGAESYSWRWCEVGDCDEYSEGATTALRNLVNELSAGTEYEFGVRATSASLPDSDWASETATTLSESELSIDADAIAGDGWVNIAEKAAGFAIGGTAVAGASVSLTVGGTALSAVLADSQGSWSVSVLANSAYITEGSVSISAESVKDGHDDATAEATFRVDLTAPTVSYTAPDSLKVNAKATINPTTSDTDIDLYDEADGHALPAGLSLDELKGVVSGTPKRRGDEDTTTDITVRDEAGNTSTATLQLPRVEGLEQVLEDYEYSPAEITWGDDAPMLTAPTGAEGALSYSVAEDTESVCSVDATSGALTLESPGECKIFATAAATETHEAKTDTAKVTINAPTLTGELRAVKRSNGQIEFAFRPTGGEDLLPSPNRFVLPSEMTPGKWTNSSSFTTTIDELEFTVGNISVRLNCAGYIEVTLLPGEGERISPTMRNFYYKTAVVDAWRRSASLTVTLTLPDEEEEAEGAVGTAGVRMQAAVAEFVYPAGVEGGLMAEAAAVGGSAVSTAPCTPEGLEVTEIAQHSMTLSWDPAPGAASYEVMRTDATTPEASSGTTSHEFDELSAASEYRLSVRSKRGAQTSAWAHSTETTLACGNVPASARTRPVSELRWSGSGAIQDEQRRDGTQPQTRTVDWNDGTCTGTVGEWEDEGQPSWGQWSDTDRQRCNPVEPVKPLTTRTASVTVTLREWQVRGDTAYERVRTDTEHYSRSVTREPVSEGCGWVIELWGSPDRVEAGSARDSGTTKVRPAAEGRTVTLSTTYSWVVRGDVAHQQVTVRKRDDVRPYVWSSAPTNAWQAGSWQLGTPYTVGPTDTGSSLTRPEPEERTVTLSTTHSWDVRGSVAYQQVTVRKRDDLRPYVWSGAPTNAWQLGSWQEGTPYTEGPTDTGTTLTKPDDYTIGPISARDADQDVYRWVVVFGPNLTCREHQEVSEATKWTTYRVTYTWGGTSWDSVVTSSFYHTYGSYKRTGETRACNFGPSGSSATSDGFLLAAGDYELEWSSGRIAFSVPAGASVTLSWRELADGSSQAVFSLSDGGELVVAADALSSASGSGAPDNPTLAAIAASLRDPTTESAAATAASSTACATGAQSTDGVTQVDLDASACTIIGSGGSLKVTSGGVSRSFNLPTGQEWLIINASTGNGGDAAAMLVEIASGGRVTVDLAGGTELARSVPAGRPDLGALFDSLTTRPSEPGT